MSKGLGVNQQVIDKFSTPRTEEEVNMVFHVTNILKETVGETASINFSNNPMIVTIGNLSTESQRVIINRYFINLFLSYRFVHNKNVELQILSLVNDGYVEDWFKLFKEYIVPFIKENKLLD